MRLITFILKDIKYKLGLYLMRAGTYVRLGVFLAPGSYILYSKNVTVGKNFTMGPFAQVLCQDPNKGSKVTLGDNVSINHHVFINADCGGVITIGNNVIIGPLTILRAANHRADEINVPIRYQGHKPGFIIVEDDVWLGSGVVVLPDVRIGRSSIIGAGSVVTNDIPAFSVAVGIPAKVVRHRR